MKTDQLVKQAKQGNKEALLQLIMAEQDSFYRLAYSYMSNPHDAMDAMEDMIVRVYENIGQLKKAEAFYSWSKTILINSCKSLLNKRNKLVLMGDWTADSVQEQGRGLTGDVYHSTEEQMDIQQLLLGINGDQREAIQLKYLHDLDYRTIAQITGASVGTVKSRIFNGLRKLREQLGGERVE